MAVAANDAVLQPAAGVLPTLEARGLHHAVPCTRHGRLTVTAGHRAAQLPVSQHRQCQPQRALLAS